jgi:hypothetical protein
MLGGADHGREARTAAHGEETKNLDLKKGREVSKRVIKKNTAWLKEMAKR